MLRDSLTLAPLPHRRHDDRIPSGGAWGQLSRYHAPRRRLSTTTCWPRRPLAGAHAGAIVSTLPPEYWDDHPIGLMG